MMKGWLVTSLLSSKRQARVVEACVESSVLYDFYARVWNKGKLRGAKVDEQGLQSRVQ